MGTLLSQTPVRFDLDDFLVFNNPDDLVYIGQTSESPLIFLTVEEMDHIIAEVEAPKMAAILRAAGGTQRSTKFKRPDDGQQETHR